MTFLSPLLLAALPAAAVPVLIHLLNRGKPRRVSWAAMQFLLDSVRKNRRRIQLRDLILLATRIVLALLLILLFARPAIWVPVGASGVLPSPVSAMIVMDVSASMAQSDGRQSRLEPAREEALKIIDRMSPDSVCGLIAATDTASPVIPRPTNNLELVRQEAERIETTSLATNLFPAIERAFQELSRENAAERIVFVITDSQRSAWRESAAIRDLSSKHPGIALRSIPVARSGEPNVAITRITVQPVSPRRGEPAVVRVDVSNFTPAPISQIRLTLAANRSAPENETTIPLIEPGKTVSASLNITFDKEGPQTLRAEIPPDHFSPDNQISLAVNVGNPRKVFIVSETSPGDERTTPGFFVSKAVAATPKRASVETIPPQLLDAERIGKASAIMICGTSGINDSQWRELENFTRNGGGVIIFPDPSTGGALGATAATQWLPGSLGAVLPSKAAWVQSGLRHPATSEWSDAAKTRLTNIVSTSRLELKPRPEALTIASYADGVPVAVSTGVGKGRVVLWGVCPVPASTNLVLHPFFPILTGSLLDYVSPEESASQSIRAGQAFTMPVNPSLAGKKIFLESDRDASRIEAGIVTVANDTAVLTVSGIEKPGGYRVFIDDSVEPVTSFAIVLEPSESLLAMTEPVEIESAAGTTSAAKNQSPAKVPREIWTLFAFLLLALFIGELAMAHRFSTAQR